MAAPKDRQMDKRLTPYLRRRVMELAYSDRVLLLRELNDSVRTRPFVQPADRLRELGDKMNALAGVNIRGRGRTRPLVEARMVFTLVARLEGITQEEIAAYLGQDHSTVSYGEKRMRVAMSVPKAYPELINLYNNYTDLTL